MGHGLSVFTSFFLCFCCSCPICAFLEAYWGDSDVIAFAASKNLSIMKLRPCWWSLEKHPNGWISCSSHPLKHEVNLVRNYLRIQDQYWFTINNNNKALFHYLKLGTWITWCYLTHTCRHDMHIACIPLSSALSFLAIFKWIIYGLRSLPSVFGQHI